MSQNDVVFATNAYKRPYHVILTFAPCILLLYVYWTNQCILDGQFIILFFIYRSYMLQRQRFILRKPSLGTC